MKTIAKNATVANDEKWDAALYALEYFNDTSLLNQLIKENQKNAKADL